MNDEGPYAVLPRSGQHSGRQDRGPLPRGRLRARGRDLPVEQDSEWEATFFSAFIIPTPSVAPLLLLAWQSMQGRPSADRQEQDTLG